MAVVDPYAPCPCGSGQKFKWCCQKVEAYAARSEKLYEGGQVDAALKALDEGLRKVPDNAWLLTRKALILQEEGKPELAKTVLERAVAVQPAVLAAQALLVRAILEVDGPAAGAAQLQKALAASTPEHRGTLAETAQLVAVFLSQEEHIPAAIQHLHLAEELSGDERPMIGAALNMIQGNPAVSAWLKHPYELAPPPEGLDDASRERFDQALEAADQGLWARAAATFEALDKPESTAAILNAGLCRLWLADAAAAVAALRRYSSRIGETEEAVDLEALCQLSAPLEGDDVVERVHLIWPLKDRAAVLEALRGDTRVAFEGPGPIDPDDPDSPPVDHFVLLDRPQPAEGVVASRVEDLPVVLGRALVGQEIVALEALDDGRLDALKDRFTDLAGPGIPPAHPKTKVLDKVARVSALMQTEWLLPKAIGRPELDRLQRQNRLRVLRHVWPETPMPYLGGRTPRQAARDGHGRVALRAALCQMETSEAEWGDEAETARLRAELGLEPEPSIDPETVRIDRVHLSRLHRIPAEHLDDDRLIALYLRARMYVLSSALERSARALSQRPALLETGIIDRFGVFADLASLGLAHAGSADAFAWIQRGRRDEPAALRAANAPRWDLLEVRLRSRIEPPEVWVPLLAVALERYQQDPEASQVILSNLLDMGLVQLVPAPDRPEGMYLDTRRLSALISHYGPKVTTAAGGLGISATKGEIWTPGGPSSGSSSGLWTPGSTPAAGGDKPKLILPGR